MRKTVLGGAVLAAALVLSPLGTGAAFAAGARAQGPATATCPAPTDSDLSISAGTPAVLTADRGVAYETLSLTTDVDLIPSFDFTVTPPSPPGPTGTSTDMNWSIDGSGETTGAGGTDFSEQASAGQLEPGAHTLVFGITLDIVLGMPAGSYTAGLTWYAEQSCPGIGFVSLSSPTYTVSLPSLIYAPSTSAGGSAGAPGASSGQPADGTSAVGASAPPSAAASASATAAASASASGDSAAGAAAVPSATPSTRATEGSVKLTGSAPASSDSTTVWMLAAVVLALLVGSVASGFIVKRRRLALHGAPAEASAGPAGTARPGTPPDSDTGPLPPWTPTP